MSIDMTTTFTHEVGKRTFTIGITPDEIIESPRTAYDGHVGLFLAKHPRYNLGDVKDGEYGIIPGTDCSVDLETVHHAVNMQKAPFVKWAEDEGYAPEDAEADYDVIDKCVYLPLYLLDHSGLSLHTRRTCRWDSGLIGYAIAYVGPDGNADEVEKQLQAEFDDYARWIEGDCYYWSVSDETGRVLDQMSDVCGYSFDTAKQHAEGFCAGYAAEWPEPPSGYYVWEGTVPHGKPIHFPSARTALDAVSSYAVSIMREGLVASSRTITKPLVVSRYPDHDAHSSEYEELHAVLHPATPRCADFGGHRHHLWRDTEATSTGTVSVCQRCTLIRSIDLTGGRTKDGRVHPVIEYFSS